MPSKLRQLLTPGRHRLSLGRVQEAVELVLASPRQAETLVELLWDDDPGIVNRAAQVVELVSRQRPQLFQPWKTELIGLLAEAKEKKLRWSLTAVVPRLQLSPAECERLSGLLQDLLTDSSSIVKTNALEGLTRLAGQDPRMLPEVCELLRLHGRSGTPAMRSRSHNLLKRLIQTEEI